MSTGEVVRSGTIFLIFSLKRQRREGGLSVFC